MTAEEFAREWEMWRASPITQAFFARLGAEQALCKENWMSLSWDGETLSEAKLAYLKARHELCEDLIEMTPEEMRTQDERQHIGHQARGVQRRR